MPEASINDKFLLKIFDSNVKYRVEDEILVCQYLRNVGFNTSEHVATKEGLYIYKFDERKIHLQKKLPGITGKKNSLNVSQSQALFELLKYVNQRLMDFPFDAKVNMLFAHEYCMNDVISLIAKRLDNTAPALVETTRRKIKLLNRIGFEKGRIQNCLLSHADYNIQQLSCNELDSVTNNTAVIDFSHVSRVPMEWEIIRASLRSIEFRKSSCIQAILSAFSMFENIIPINYDNICISIIQLISST